MKIAIIGAGLTGLSAAYELSKMGHQVYVFEKDENPGGLALGFKNNNWQWSLEKHYHHWFTNDKSVLSLAKEINHEVITKRPKTSVFVNDTIFQFDSAMHVLTFPLLNIIEKLRMGITIAFLKYNPFWKSLEKYNAVSFLSKFMGEKSYSLIWKALLINKFGKFSNNVSLAWFWARIVKRTPSLSYPKGGFLEFSINLTEKIKKNKGNFLFNTEITELTSKNKPNIKYINLKTKITNSKEFDKVIITTPSYIFLNISPNLPKDYIKKIKPLKHLGALSLILRLNKPFFKDGTYWLNICDEKSPIMAVVEHTNFMDSKFYNNEHILYIGNYKSSEDKLFNMTKDELLNLYSPYLKRINKNYYENIIDVTLFKDSFAQPVIPINYSKHVPTFKTPLNNVYLTNMQQVYPWDRGTNYAIEWGRKIANLIINNEI